MRHAVICAFAGLLFLLTSITAAPAGEFDRTVLIVRIVIPSGLA